MRTNFGLHAGPSRPLRHAGPADADPRSRRSPGAGTAEESDPERLMRKPGWAIRCREADWPLLRCRLIRAGRTLDRPCNLTRIERTKPTNVDLGLRCPCHETLTEHAPITSGPILQQPDTNSSVFHSKRTVNNTSCGRQQVRCHPPLQRDDESHSTHSNEGRGALDPARLGPHPGGVSAGDQIADWPC